MTLAKTFSIAALTTALTTGALFAGDNGLYEAPPPDDAAFLRWIDAGAAPDVFGVTGFDADNDAFRPVSATATDGAKAGAFYSAARAANGEVVVIEEPARADRSKVLLTLLNLTDDPIRLVLLDQNVEVIAHTGVNAAGGRAVNPVSVSLSVLADDDTVLGTFDAELRRGQNVTFVARPNGVQLIENRFGPNLEG